MKYVYYILEKIEYTNVDNEEDFVVYETFDKAVSVSKALLKQEFDYIESLYDESNLEQDFVVNVQKEVCEGSVFNEDDVLFRLSVKKIPVLS